MTFVPRAYPLLARLHYAYSEAGERLNVAENAWWERRPDGGRALGAVVEAMDHPRHPHRLRIHLRLGPNHSPMEMQATLLRPDGSGEARYVFHPEAVEASGDWNGEAFEDFISMPPGYTVAPSCMAADGLHFLKLPDGGLARSLNCYLLAPHRTTAPLLGQPATFSAQFVGKETVGIDGDAVPACRVRAAYAAAPHRPADFRLTREGYLLRMTAQRRDGASTEAICTRFTRFEGAAGDGKM